MKLTIVVGLFLVFWLAPIHRVDAAQAQAEPSARGPDGEISAMGSFSKTDFGNNTYSIARRYTATAGLNLTALTEIELSYSYTDTFLNYDPVQTTSVNEQSLGLSVVQSLLPSRLFFQPYVKGGAAQYNRRQSGTIAGIPTTPQSSKAPSGILGAGFRLFLLRNFSLKVEGVAYLPDFNISHAKDNFSVQGGFGWQF